MNRDSIIKTIGTTLADIIDEDSVALTEATTADDVEGWDSIAHVKLIIALESAFGVRFESSEISAPDNVGQLVSLIEGKLAKA